MAGWRYSPDDDSSAAAAVPGPLPVITPHGDFGEGTLPPLEAQIREAVNTHGGLILDAVSITFGDSTFLRLLLATHQEADLRIAASSPAVTRLISIVGADQVLNIHPTLEAARNA
ncbi:STAS domain-containing protein [Streptomyces microflavus]|uniref:STAS domain-containing protein n=1 Tax=Streptomyces microflavus TaxID=1919 RepID=UPI00364FBBEE